MIVMMIAFIILIIIITISSVMAIIYLVFMAHSEMVTYIVSSDSCLIQGPTLSPCSRPGWWQLPQAPPEPDRVQPRANKWGRTLEQENSLNLPNKERICDSETSVVVLTSQCPRALEVNSLSSHVGPQG